MSTHDLAEKDLKGARERLQARINPAMGQSIDCEAGWLPLIVELDASLQEIDTDYTVTRIKEKFGGLRFYASTTRTEGDGEEFRRLIREAEDRAWHICEWCGSTSDVTTDSPPGWIRTRCAECRSAGLPEYARMTSRVSPQD